MDNYIDILTFAHEVKIAVLAAIGTDYGSLSDTQAQRVDLAVQEIIDTK